MRKVRRLGETIMMDQFVVVRSQYAIMGRSGPCGFNWTRTLRVLDADGFVISEHLLN